MNVDLTAATQAEPQLVMPADAAPGHARGASRSGRRSGAPRPIDLTLSGDEDDGDEVVLVMSKPGTLRPPTVKRPRQAQPTVAPPLAPALPSWAPPVRAPSPEREGRKCPVCLDVMEQMATTPCGHVFCHQCLIDCVKAQKKCPKCRKAVQLKQIHRLFMD